MFVHGFRISYCPRYDDLAAEAEQIRENRLAQATLLNVLRYAFVRRQAAVELRYVADPAQRTVHIYLLLGGAAGEGANVVERLLPSEYGWVRMGLSADPLGPRPRPERGRPLHEVHVVRRVEFLNLPAGGDRLPDGPAGDFAPGRFLPPLLPLTPAGRAAEHERRQLCAPVLGPLADLSPDRRRLCEELQHAAPVVVSVTLSPPDAAGLDADRAVAAAVRRWIDPHARRFDKAGFGPTPTAGFDRYTLPANNLCRVSVRVAAADADAAQGVAHCLIGHLGGLRAFEVFGPFPVAEFTPGPLLPPDFDRVYAAHRMRADGVTADDDAYAGFLARMAPLATLDEAGVLVRLPYGRAAGLPGLETRPVPPFHASAVRRRPADAVPPADEIRVGLHRTATPGPAAADWHTLRRDDLTRHALITGMTGSGKTVATTFLVRELARLGVPFLILEPVKTEYYDRLRGLVPGLRRWRLEGTADGRPVPDFLAFDPLRLPSGVSIGRHVGYLKAAFQAAFPMDEVLSLVLENGLRRYYAAPVTVGGCELPAFARGSVAAHRVRSSRDGKRRRPFPGAFDFQDFFLTKYLPVALDPKGKGGEAGAKLYEWQQIFRRRFDNLLGGPVGLACKRADAVFLAAWDRGRAAVTDRAVNPFAELLTGPTVVELDGVTDPEQKALLMALLLTFLYEQRQAEDAARREAAATAGDRPATEATLRHCLVIEEAHRLLSRDAVEGRAGEAAGRSARGQAMGLFVDMLAEIRAYGQGLVLVEQIPTKLLPEAVKNTNLKMMLRLPAADDREYLGGAMNFTPTQQAFVTSLRAGQFVVFEDGLDQPVLLGLPPEPAWDRLGVFGQKSPA